jgi:hypothetical protein
MAPSQLTIATPTDAVRDSVAPDVVAVTLLPDVATTATLIMVAVAGLDETAREFATVTATLAAEQSVAPRADDDTVALKAPKSNRDAVTGVPWAAIRGPQRRSLLRWWQTTTSRLRPHHCPRR